MRTLPNKTRTRAMEVLAHHMVNVGRYCGDLLQAVVLTGSLVNGSYMGDAGSDIDLVHVLRDGAPENARQEVMDCIARSEQVTGRDLPIARCVYRLHDLYPPYPTEFPLCPENKDYIELPIELLRLTDAAQVVWGALELREIPVPSRADVMACQALSARWVQQMLDAGVPLPPQDDPPVRLMVQSVLVHALLDVFFATGRSCSSKAAVAERLREGVPDYPFLPLVEACTRWRYAPETFTEADEASVRRQWPCWQAARKVLGPGEYPRKADV